MWDIAEMALTHFSVPVFQISLLSLDEPTMEDVLFADNEEGYNEKVIGLPSASS